MDICDLNTDSIVLLGCGKMGSALVSGWLEAGLRPAAVTVIDPRPSDWVLQSGVRVNPDKIPPNPAVVMVAIKPQIMGQVAALLRNLLGPSTVVISVAAGTALAWFEGVLPPHTPVIRAMPNTPAAVKKGITAMIANPAGTAHYAVAQAMLGAVGQVVTLDREDQIDAVTGVSGSGPAYVFYMIETLAAAASAQGLPDDMAMQLAKATVAGAGALAEQTENTPGQLRANVTSPNGTTQAGLSVLMQAETGLGPLMAATVAAAANRSRDLKE